MGGEMDQGSEIRFFGNQNNQNNQNNSIKKLFLETAGQTLASTSSSTSIENNFAFKTNHQQEISGSFVIQGFKTFWHEPTQSNYLIEDEERENTIDYPKTYYRVLENLKLRTSRRNIQENGTNNNVILGDLSRNNLLYSNQEYAEYQTQGKEKDEINTTIDKYFEDIVNGNDLLFKTFTTVFALSICDEFFNVYYYKASENGSIEKISYEEFNEISNTINNIEEIPNLTPLEQYNAMIANAKNAGLHPIITFEDVMEYTMDHENDEAVLYQKEMRAIPYVDCSITGELAKHFEVEKITDRICAKVDNIRTTHHNETKETLATFLNEYKAIENIEDRLLQTIKTLAFFYKQAKDKSSNSSFAKGIASICEEEFGIHNIDSVNNIINSMGAYTDNSDYYEDRMQDMIQAVLDHIEIEDLNQDNGHSGIRSSDLQQAPQVENAEEGIEDFHLML
jgi:hypothetical protein